MICALVAASLAYGVVGKGTADAATAPIAGWSFEEGQGEIAHDVFGEDDGNLLADWYSPTPELPKWVKGHYGTGVEFNGENYIEVPSAANLDQTHNLTLEGWVNVTKTPSEEEEEAALIVGEHNSYNEGHPLAFGLTVAASATGNALIDAEIHDLEGHEVYGEISLRKWTFLAMTLETLSKHESILSLYINGELVESVNAEYIMEEGGAFEFGQGFDGRLDDVREYGEALTEAEIDEDMETPLESRESHGPVAMYGFDEGQGVIAADATGEHPGTLEPGISGSAAGWTEGQNGLALRLGKGADRCMSVSPSTDLELPEQFTIEAWFMSEKGASEGSYRLPIFATSGQSSEQYPISLVLENGVITGSLQSATNLTISKQVGTGTLHPREWNQLALVYNGTSLKMVLNGVTTQSVSVPFVHGDSTGPIQIGCKGTETGTGRGRLDDLRIYERALTADEIDVDASSAVGTPRPPGPIRAYNFDAGTGTVAYDSIEGKSATVEGASWTGGVLGSALEFNGSTSCASAPSGPDLRLSEAYTVEAWIKLPEKVENVLPIVENTWTKAEYASVDLTWGLQVLANGKLQGIQSYSPGLTTSVTSSGAIPKGVWVHVALEGVRGASNQTKLFEGAEGETPTQVGEGGFGEPLWSDGPLLIGCSPPYEGSGSETLGKHFKGGIDEVRIYNRNLSPTELAASYDTTAPELDLSGGLAESAEGPLGVGGATLDVTATEPEEERDSGIERVTLSVDGSLKAEHSPCETCSPGELAFEYFFSKYAFAEGAHTVEVAAFDKAGNVSRKDLVVDVPEGPSVSLGGDLYEYRGQAMSRSARRSLSVSAAQSDESTTAPRPGVKAIAIEVDGKLEKEDGPQTCSAGNCGLETTWTYAPSGKEKTHVITVVVTDEAGNRTERSFSVKIGGTCENAAEEPKSACSGDLGIDHILEYSGNPSSGGGLLAEEWIEPGTPFARRVSEDYVETRGAVPCTTSPAGQCGQVRSIVRSATPGAHDFVVVTGQSLEDEDLDSVADVYEVERSELGEPVAEGSLASALAPWQAPPPGHGSQFVEYEEEIEVPEGPTEVSRWWYDKGTGLMIKFVSEDVTEGRAEATARVKRLFDYDQNQRSQTAYGADLFLAHKPSRLGSEVNLETPGDLGEAEIVE